MKQFEFLIKQMQLCHLIDEQLEIFKAILYCHRDGFTECWWSKLSNLISEKKIE
jgi:hypothetical protein